MSDTPINKGFHTHDEWHFEAREDGGVTIRPPKGEPHELTIDAWASVVASMSAGGEGDLRWYAARKFLSSTGIVDIVAIRYEGGIPTVTAPELVTR